jgi:hypothetical protein
LGVRLLAKAADIAQVTEAVTSWEQKITQYRRKYVTMQDDGSEDDLSYIKVAISGYTLH